MPHNVKVGDQTIIYQNADDICQQYDSAQTEKLSEHYFASTLANRRDQPELYRNVMPIFQNLYLQWRLRR